MGHTNRSRSELQASLKGDHARRAITAQTDTEQAGRRRGRGSNRAKPTLGSRTSRNARQHHARKREIRMVEYIEELDVEAHLHTLGHRKPLGEIEVTPRKIGTTQRVTAEVSELTILGSVGIRVAGVIAFSSARVHGRDKGIGVEPLNRARLCDTNGTANFGGDGGPALTAELKQPAGIAIGPGGEVYIGDSGNNRIRVLTPPWAVITSPTPGSVLPGPTVTFAWNAATNGSTYQLDVSDKIGPLGQGDISWGSAITGQSDAVGNIPCDGRTIYVRLATLDANGIPQDPGPYVYHACKTVNMSVTPTTLPQTGGTVDIFIVKGNYYPGSRLTLTRAPYPEICFIACRPTVLGLGRLRRRATSPSTLSITTASMFRPSHRHIRMRSSSFSRQRSIPEGWRKIL
jgi:hypothetical protein